MQDQPEECQCCDFPTDNLTFYPDWGDHGAWMCDLCSGTFKQNATNADILKALSYVGNWLMDERQVPGYKYRLTFTFVSSKQWKLGVDSLVTIGELCDTLVTSATAKGGEIATVCLSEEKTGKVLWMKRGDQF